MALNDIVYKKCLELRDELEYRKQTKRRKQH
jgi:hypothetical protein